METEKHEETKRIQKAGHLGENSCPLKVYHYEFISDMLHGSFFGKSQRGILSHKLK